MRKMMTALALLGLAGCTGTTGGSYSASSQYAHEREMILAGSGPAAGGAQGASALAAPAVSSQPLSAMGTTAGAGNGSAVASQTDAMLNATAAAPEAVNEIGISEENNFEAVGEQRSREEDAALIAANRARYEQVQPTALPQREATGPNIVAYALNSTNPKGVQIYQRGSLFTESRNARNCSKFPSPDMAQRQFLASGGPQKDPKALDPDGDGYACSWDPAPFRKAAAAANG
ncbi:hypothetical protein HCZ97_16645 [Pseudooceanicola sp. HF7]|nr:hypothetical protein [Pseudooceanicola sp. HF7]